MTKPPPPSNHHRARDPGVKLGELGAVTWVHCPSCNGAARLSHKGVDCRHCGYVTIQQEPAENRWARIAIDDPHCSFCRAPLPTTAFPTARWEDGKRLVRVQCPACRKTVDYPAAYGWSPATPAQAPGLPLFLTAKVAGESLWVENLAHLDALEEYLGAQVRERGPVRGLTMMARLPAWMKAAHNRPKIVRALRLLRQRAQKAGIDE